MNAYFGTSNVPAKQLFVGNSKIWKVYKGSSLIWKLNNVDFVDDDGTIYSHQEVVSGNDAIKPTDPTRPNYTFVGWSGSWTNITTHTTLTAQWSSNRYNVTLKPNYNTQDFPGISGQNTDVIVPVTYGSNYPTFSPVFTANGYTFKNWQDGTTEANFRDGYQLTDQLVQITSSRDFLAKWTPKTYNITYSLDGGTNDPDNPSTYTFGTTVQLREAQKDGFVFEAWIDSAGNSVNEINSKTIFNDEGISLSATYHVYDPDAISEFKSDDVNLHGWKRGYYDSRPVVYNFIPGNYSLTVVGSGGAGSINTHTVIPNARWSGYTAGGGSGAYLSGTINIPANDNSLSVQVRYAPTGNKERCSLVISQSRALSVVVGMGGKGHGNSSTPIGYGGEGGVVSCAIGVENVCEISGNAGATVYGYYGVGYPLPKEPGAAGGIYATDDCQYGGGDGAGQNYPEYPNTSYEPQYGLIHIKRIGD